MFTIKLLMMIGFMNRIVPSEAIFLMGARTKIIHFRCCPVLTCHVKPIPNIV